MTVLWINKYHVTGRRAVPIAFQKIMLYIDLTKQWMSQGSLVLQVWIFWQHPQQQFPPRMFPTSGVYIYIHKSLFLCDFCMTVSFDISTTLDTAMYNGTVLPPQTPSATQLFPLIFSGISCKKEGVGWLRINWPLFFPLSAFVFDTLITMKILEK